MPGFCYLHDKHIVDLLGANKKVDHISFSIDYFAEKDIVNKSVFTA